MCTCTYTRICVLYHRFGIKINGYLENTTQIIWPSNMIRLISSKVPSLSLNKGVGSIWHRGIFQGTLKKNNVHSTCSSQEHRPSENKPSSQSAGTCTYTSLPPISHILETCLYVRDMEASVNFYQDILQTKPFTISVRTDSSIFGGVVLLYVQCFSFSSTFGIINFFFFSYNSLECQDSPSPIQHYYYSKQAQPLEMCNSRRGRLLATVQRKILLHRCFPPNRLLLPPREREPAIPVWDSIIASQFKNQRM